MTWRLARDRSGAGAAEFALVLPLLLFMLFGIIDAGRFMWETNRAEKATQMGARMAVVTDVLSTGLAAENYVGQTIGGTTLTQGDIIPASALGTITCTQSSCTCSGACPASYATVDAASFGRIVGIMQDMKSDISASNVTVSYRGSGLGFAGDPNGMEIAPLVTVELSDVRFYPVSTSLFGWPYFSLPPFRTTLTSEDSSGIKSN